MCDAAVEIRSVRTRGPVGWLDTGRMAVESPAPDPKSSEDGTKCAIRQPGRARSPKLPSSSAIWDLVQVEGGGDPEIARVAAAQRGCVSREQLLAAGVGRGAISHRLERRLLHRFHPGVYLVGHTVLAPLAAEMAALLYDRGHAVLSHPSAASIWGFAEPVTDAITLTIVGKDVRSRPGLRLFRVPELDRRDLRIREGLPVTSPARTLLDFATRRSRHSSRGWRRPRCRGWPPKLS